MAPIAISFATNQNPTKIQIDCNGNGVTVGKQCW